MDVNLSNCIYCNRRIHYSEARLLPEGGGVCVSCSQAHGYKVCDECQDYFIPQSSEDFFCEICIKRIFTQMI